MDGGFTNNTPNVGDPTITVSPFGHNADICPRDNAWLSLKVASEDGFLSKSETFSHEL